VAVATDSAEDNNPKYPKYVSFKDFNTDGTVTSSEFTYGSRS